MGNGIVTASAKKNGIGHDVVLRPRRFGGSHESTDCAFQPALKMRLQMNGSALAAILEKHFMEGNRPMGDEGFAQMGFRIITVADLKAKRA